MAVKDQRFEITCPDCGKTRTIGYVPMTLIRRGKQGMSCRACACGKQGRSGRPLLDPLAISLRGSKFHETWSRIWTRCTNPNADNWAYYGGRGIRVCDRWKSFEAFVADMYPSYEEGLTIERNDSDGPYSPENCRWATMAEQVVNRRSNRRVTFQGRTQTISQWAAELGLDYFTLRKRLNRGWPVERALTAPVMSYREAAQLGGQARWNGK